MFYFCPNCGNKAVSTRYIDKGRIFHYFTCPCGCNNKPKDLPENKEPEKE